MGNVIKVPVSDLIALGDHLQTIESQLETEGNKDRLIHGLDPKHGEQHVRVAEEGFEEAWKTSIKKLLEDLDGIAELSTAIGRKADVLDERIAGTVDGMAGELAQFNFHL